MQTFSLLPFEMAEKNILHLHGGFWDITFENQLAKLYTRERRYLRENSTLCSNFIFTRPKTVKLLNLKLP